MATYTDPGVYVEELAGPQIITGASTSVTAFIGRCEKGPINEAVFVTSWSAFQSMFGRPVWGAQLPDGIYAYFINGGNSAYVVRQTASGEAAATATLDALTFIAATPGGWGNDLRIQITNSPPDQSGETLDFALHILRKRPGPDPTLIQSLTSQYVALNDRGAVTLQGETYDVLESYGGLSDTDLIGLAGAGSPTPVEQRINTQSRFIRVAVASSNAVTRPANTDVPLSLTGGVGNARDTPLVLETGLQALDAADDISLIVAPEVSMIDDLAAQRAAAHQILTHCETRVYRDRFAILSSPYGLSPDEVRNYVSGAAVRTAPVGTALHSSYGAIYYPWLATLDPSTTRSVMVPPAPGLAGLYANADTAIGVFQSPAGITYGAVQSADTLERSLTTGDIETLVPAAINPIRNMPNYGITVWGARTLSSDPELTYIAVRRTLIYIEVSLRNGLNWAIFEPNDEQLWSSVRRDVAEFLNQLWLQGGLIGATAREAYFVTCDASNNPPEARISGNLYVDVGFAPSHPAEFVILRLQLQTIDG